MQHSLRAFLLAFVLTSAYMSAAVFQVNVDTSSLPAGTMGFLDFQFNGSGGPVPSGTARVADFSGVNFSVDDSLAASFGTVNGTLVPGPLAIENTDFFNDYFVPFTVSGAGSGFSFLVSILGDVLAPPPGNLDGSDFALLIFANDGFTPLLTQDGQLARISVDALGELASDAVSPAQISPVAVPEPASIGLVAGGALLLALRATRRRVS